MLALKRKRKWRWPATIYVIMALRQHRGFSYEKPEKAQQCVLTAGWRVTPENKAAPKTINAPHENALS